mgnify:CR=1 FL=1|jgi:DnaJ-domain-containing protein 1|tara:strand:+ start:603 stop:875 length:273 start_codon:yes stop_codon:yes gene_type:complete
MPKITINGIEQELTNEQFAQYQVSPEEEFELSIARLRFRRNSLLAKTDWYANSDVTMSDDMKTYRQELRDITNGLTTVEDVEAVVFPTKP